MRAFAVAIFALVLASSMVSALGSKSNPLLKIYKSTSGCSGLTTSTTITNNTCQDIVAHGVTQYMTVQCLPNGKAKVINCTGSCACSSLSSYTASSGFCEPTFGANAYTTRAYCSAGALVSGAVAVMVAVVASML